MESLFEYFFKFRAFGFGLSFQAIFHRFKIHDEENAHVVEDGRKDRSFADRPVGDSQNLHHEEDRPAHDRGHELAAHPGGGLHRRGKMRFIPRLFHHRNGDLPDGRHIGHGAAGDHPEEGTGYDRDFGRPSADVPEEAGGQAEEESPAPDSCMNVPKRTKRKIKVLEIPVSGPVDSFRRHKQAADDPLDGIIRMAQHVRKPFAEKGIEERACTEDGQRPSRGPAARLQRQKDQDPPEEELIHGRFEADLIGPGDKVGNNVIADVEEERPQTEPRPS